MKLAIVGDDHPLAAALKALDPETEPLAWGTPTSDVGGYHGIVLAPPLWDAEPETPEAVLDDLDVLWAWLNPWVPTARERGQGVVLYVTSLDGICGSGDNVLLTQRDSAMLAQARAMAMELGRFGIRSNCLALGPLVENTDQADESHQKNPLKRAGTWGEAAKTAAFLLGEGAAHVSGQLLVCAGGADVGRIVP